MSEAYTVERKSCPGQKFADFENPVFSCCHYHAGHHGGCCGRCAIMSKRPVALAKRINVPHSLFFCHMFFVRSVDCASHRAHPPQTDHPFSGDPPIWAAPCAVSEGGFASVWLLLNLIIILLFIVAFVKTVGKDNFSPIYYTLCCCQWLTKTQNAQQNAQEKTLDTVETVSMIAPSDAASKGRYALIKQKLWEVNSQMSSNYHDLARPNHQPIGGSYPNHQGIWTHRGAVSVVQV